MAISILIVLIGATPSVAQTLAHPNAPIFKACAADMNVPADTIVQRILATGWTETDFTPELQALGQDLAILRYFGGSAYLGETSKDDWDARIDELSGPNGLYVYTSDPVARAFKDPNQSGYAVLTPDLDDYWFCEILLTKEPPDAWEFMSQASSVSDRSTADGLVYVSDHIPVNELFEFLGLLPFLPSAKRYYSEFVLADPETVEAQYGRKIKVVFAADFSTAYPF